MKDCTYDQFKNQFKNVSGHAKRISGKPGDNDKLEEEAAAEMMASDSQDRLDRFMKIFSKL